MSDYETLQKRRNFVVGIFVLIGLCALIWLIFKFGDLPIKVSEIRSFEVIVQFPTAKGIQKNAPVEFCGYQIGKVTHVMSPERIRDLNTGLEYHQTKVILSIEKEYVDIPSNVDVKLMTRSLGSSYVELILDPTKSLEPREPNDPNTVYLMNGMFLQGSTGMTSEFFPQESQEKLVELIDGVNQLVANANDVIGDQANKENFKQIMTNLVEATGELQQTLEDFQQFTAAGKSAIENADAKIDQAVTAFLETTQKFQEFTTTGTETLNSVDSKAGELVKSIVVASEELGRATSQLRLIMEKINYGQGFAAKILNDAKLYENLLDNTRQLEELLESLKSLIEKIEEKGLSKVWSGK